MATRCVKSCFYSSNYLAEEQECADVPERHVGVRGARSASLQLLFPLRIDQQTPQIQICGVYCFFFVPCTRVRLPVCAGCCSASHQHLDPLTSAVVGRMSKQTGAGRTRWDDGDSYPIFLTR